MKDKKLDLENLMAERVTVTPHLRGGPVNVDLEGVSLKDLLRAMGVEHDAIRQYLEATEKMEGLRTESIMPVKCKNCGATVPITINDSSRGAPAEECPDCGRYTVLVQKADGEWMSLIELAPGGGIVTEGE